MRVRYLQCMAGTFHCRNVGDVVDMPKEEAAPLIAAGFAEEVKAKDGEADDAPAGEG
jgi:hypothetical protein